MIEIALLGVIALLLFLIWSGQESERKERQADREARAERQLRRHEVDLAAWEKVFEAREDRMRAWDLTDAGDRLAYLASGLCHVPKADSKGVHWLGFRGADMPYPASPEEVAGMRSELIALDAKRRSVWQFLVADLPLPIVSEHPRGEVRVPSADVANAYRRPYWFGGDFPTQ